MTEPQFTLYARFAPKRGETGVFVTSAENPAASERGLLRKREAKYESGIGNPVP